MSTLATFVERIDEQSRRVDPGRALLVIVAVPFFVVGWLIGQSVRAFLAVLRWVWSAVVVGFQAARGEP